MSDIFFIEEKINELLTAKFQEDDFLDCFLVELNLKRGKKLEVFIDSDSGFTLEKCQLISRYLEANLDEKGWLGEDYILEVSSPGLDRPLRFRRQYHKNIGRRLEVTLNDGTTIKGLLTSAGETTIVLEEEISFRKGKKRKKEIKEIVVPFDQIQKALVIVTF